MKPVDELTLEELRDAVAVEVMELRPPVRDGAGDLPCPVCKEPMWTPEMAAARMRCTSCKEWRYSIWPDYPGDIVAAWEVVEKMFDVDDQLLFLAFREDMAREGELGPARIIAPRICRAALKAVRAREHA